MQEKPPLPEEFAPTGPKLSRFPIQPAPAVRPHLFPDEARFVLRLSVLAGATEFAAWAWFAAAGPQKTVLALAALRLLRPLWARLGALLSRPAVGALLLVAALGALLSRGQLYWLVGLPALGDLCASCIGDRITVERRAVAYAWLDMGQALGAALGLALGGFAAIGSIAVLLIGAVALPDLRDRGTPRSTWPLSAYAATLRTPIAAQLTGLAFLCGALARLAWSPGWAAILPLAGMAIAARLERWMPNAIWLPRIAVLLAAAGWAFAPVRLVAMGVMLAAIPAAVARGAGEMERPLASSLAWSALIAGAAAGAVLHY